VAVASCAWACDIGFGHTDFNGCLADKKDQKEVDASKSNPAGETDKNNIASIIS